MADTRHDVDVVDDASDASAPGNGDGDRDATIVIDTAAPRSDGPSDGPSEGPSVGPLEGEPAWSDRFVAAVSDRWVIALTGVLGLVALGILVGLEEISVGGVLVDGLRSGAVYGMVAAGIALVYRTTRVINFAQGEFGTLPAFLVLLFLLGFDLTGTVDPASIGVGAMLGITLLAMALGAVLAIGVNVAIIQRLAEANPVTSLVATAGIFMLSIGAQIVTFGLTNRRFPRVVEGSVCFVPGESVCALGTDHHNLVTLLLLGVVAIFLTALFRTSLGTALLATAQDPFAASLHGVSPRAMASLAWGLAGALAGLAGILGAGFFESISPGFMTLTFLLPAFTAAVVGGLTSVGGAMIGGLLVGLVAALANNAASGYGLTGTIPSPPDITSFSLLLLVLFLRPRGLFGKEA
ncbi:branched-chain amino acid ABC transporter permease [Nitriliruptoraceae bacterium ZYF776]|nr:branched-chain amino acid ABC transporter permease [Profundirhabdus halotolerans]